MLLQGKVAVVTGSAIGIGRGISVALAEQGANVTCLDIDLVNKRHTAELVWAAELKEKIIRVNGLCFGATDTPMLRGVAPDIADAAMKIEDLGQAVVNVLAHGDGGPSGETWLFGTSGTPRTDSLAAIAALAP